MDDQHSATNAACREKAELYCGAAGTWWSAMDTPGFPDVREFHFGIHVVSNIVRSLIPGVDRQVARERDG
jgi:hypothetical protein